MLNKDDIIKILNLSPLAVEGGYFRETYRSNEIIPKDALPARYGASRSFSTQIYYLLTPDTVSALHRLKSDETFHFYLGGSVTMLLLHENGSSEIITLSSKIEDGHKVQFTVPGGSWVGCFLNDGGEFALMGTSVAPGFEYDDFELGNPDELIQKYPDRRELIKRLAPGITRSGSD
jgi:predicted cupin superfamily sugar epimerase